MRISMSLYDNLRQPSVYLEHNRDDNSLRKAVLADLRLEDLISAENPTAQPSSRLVFPRADVLDGSLMGTLTPRDVVGINLEMIVPPSVLGSDVPVSQILRPWIQNEDGTGRNAIFMFISDREKRRHFAREMCSRRHDIQSIDDVKELFQGSGLADETSKQVENWTEWQSALKPNGMLNHVLAGYRPNTGPASALQRLRERQAAFMSDPDQGYGLTNFGLKVFDEALKKLEEAKGRRDSVVMFLWDKEDEIGPNDESEQNQLNVITRLFYHHMFRVIPDANGAVSEFSTGICDPDTGLRREELEREEDYVFSNQEAPLNVPSRIVDGLGELSAQDYAKLKVDHQSKVSEGVGHYLSSKSPDLLTRAMEEVARQCPDGQRVLPLRGADEWLRRWVLRPAQSSLPVILDLIIRTTCPEVSDDTRTGVAVASRIALDPLAEIASKAATEVGVSLLKTSLQAETDKRIAARFAARS